MISLPKIPIAIIGLNFGRYIIDKQLISGPGAPYFQLGGICDMNRERVAEASAMLGVKAYADLDEVLADPVIPAIGLYTGPSRRADLLRKIIRAGKHVMTTKPFELDPAEALSVINEARDRGCIVHLNSPAPVMPMDVGQIKAWRETFNLGQPIACRADVWASYTEKADGSWLDDPKLCPVAPIFRLGIYLINDLLELFGPAEEVQVYASRLVTGRPTPDTAQLAIKFKSGALANIFSSFCVNDGDAYRNSLVLNFQHGTVYRNIGPYRSKNATNATSELALVRLNAEGERIVAAESQTDASGHYRWDLFYRAMRGEHLEGELAPEQLVGGLKIVCAMAEAHRTGLSVKIA